MSGKGKTNVEQKIWAEFVVDDVLADLVDNLDVLFADQEPTGPFDTVAATPPSPPRDDPNKVCDFVFSLLLLKVSFGPTLLKVSFGSTLLQALVTSVCVIMQKPGILYEGLNVVLEDDKLECLTRTGGQDAWLNDEVMNCYSHLLQLRAKIKTDKEKVHFFSTYFAAQLYMDNNEYNFEAAKAHVKPEVLGNQHGEECSTVLACKTLYVPVCKDNVHWFLIIVDLGSRVVTLLDSMRGGGVDLEEDEVEYKMMEAVTKFVDQLGDETQWEHRRHSGWTYQTSEDHPRQDNFFDCGVYVLMYSNYHAAGWDFNFGGKPSTLLRSSIRQSLLNKALTAFPSLPVRICYCLNIYVYVDLLLNSRF